MTGDLSAICRKHPDKFRISGTLRLDRCPVCAGTDFATIWQLPQTRLRNATYLSSRGASYHKTYLDYLPMLITPQEIFAFDLCGDCEAIFLNPKADDHAAYGEDGSKVLHYRKHGLKPWRNAAAAYLRHLPDGTRTVLDAACGAGQMLAMFRSRHASFKLIGLELSRPSVEFMRRELGLESHVADLDRDELDTVVPPGSVDYVVFNEGYEHVRAPTVVLTKLLRMLRPGGRLRFSAQAYGPQFGLQIRVGEPIFISARTLDWTLERTGAQLIDLTTTNKMYVTLEKR